MRRAGFALLALLVGCSLAVAEGADQVDRAAYALTDVHGQSKPLADWSSDKFTVLAFVGTECPLAKLYGPRLAELSAEYGPRGVAFVGVDSNRQDSLEEIAAYARRSAIEFPVLKDLGNKLADALGVDRTPEVVVLDGEGRVAYRGRIDDQYGLSKNTTYQRPKLERRDLALALDNLLAGKAPQVARTEATGCLIGRSREPKAGAEITYASHVAGILQKHCVECHRPGQIGPFSMTSYEEVAGWADMILEVIADGRMPPWHASPEFGHFSNENRLTSLEREQLTAWVEAGVPEGDPSQTPPMPTFVEGWQMPQPPDQVFEMPVDYEVPAEGVVEYQYFTVDPGFTEDRWVRFAECMPGNREVVHHIIVFVQPPKGGRRSSDTDVRAMRLLVGYAPGTRPFPMDPGMAKLIPAGSKLVFQMHYTPNGKAQTDRSRVGFVYAKPEEVTHWVGTTNAINHSFVIPAGADDYQVTAEKKLTEDVLLVSLFPHMHLRGKAFRYEAHYPDGRVETLLDVPKYDFNWQYNYVFEKPISLPKGTTLYCEARYDNSERNLANPAPDEEVRWGDQTWEEMMIGWYDVAVPIDKVKPAAPESGGGE